MGKETKRKKKNEICKNLPGRPVNDLSGLWSGLYCPQKGGKGKKRGKG